MSNNTTKKKKTNKGKSYKWIRNLAIITYVICIFAFAAKSIVMGILFLAVGIGLTILYMIMKNRKSEKAFKPAPTTVTVTKIQKFTETITASIQNRFVAFDVETTGLDPNIDRIIQIGAVIFENCVPVKRYVTFVNPERSVPEEASAVNHITDDMLRDAPNEYEAIGYLLHFLGTAAEGHHVICAHNASFDMEFLANMLRRNGVSAKLVYVDTLSLARRFIPGLQNYKLTTIAECLNIQTENAHRADADAEMCGWIFAHMLPDINESLETAVTIQNYTGE